MREGTRVKYYEIQCSDKAQLLQKMIYCKCKILENEFSVVEGS